MIKQVALAAAVLLLPASARSQDLVACLSGLKHHHDAIRACFVTEGRPLVKAGAEDPEMIAVAVDGACEGPKNAFASQLLQCMSPQQAVDTVERYVRPLRRAVVTAVVQERAYQARTKPH